MKNKILVALFITILLISIAFAIREIPQRELTRKGKLFTRIEDSKHFERITTRCRRDSDCYITTSTCCPCNSGGTQIAVNRFGLRYYDWWKEDTCQFPIKCQMVYNCYSYEAVCEKGGCKLK